jgi:NAD(P)-dependent dehydrogenase (short-subunit alcohol dehydrogenase family)
LPCDLRRPAAIEAALGQLGETFGRLDLVVNNAGIGYRARVEEMDADVLAELFETNVIAMLLVCRAALPWLRSSERPVLINIASVVGRRGVPGQSAYSASKAAVCSIGEALRLEWQGEDIAVCTLNPALTATGFFEAQSNPAGLEHPDLSGAAPAGAVAQAVLDLDRRPRPELSMRWKWRLLGMLSVLAPRLADRILADRLGGPWRRG